MRSFPRAGNLTRDGAFVYAGYVLRYLSLLVLIPYYSHVLGPGSYGKVLAAMSLMNIIWVLVSYGFSPIGAREIARAPDRSERSRIVGRQIKGRLLLVPAGIAVGAGGTMISPLLGDDPWLGFFATLAGVLAAFNLGWLFQGLRMFRTSIVMEALSYPLNLVLVVLLVRHTTDEVGAMAALSITGVICVAVAFVIVARHIDLSLRTLVAGSTEIRNAGPLFMTSVSAILMTSGSTYLLSLISAPAQVGYFGAAERFTALALGLLGPASQVLMPTISNLHDHDSGEALRLARKAVALEFSYGVLVMCGGLALSPVILPLILGESFRQSVPILQILSCLFPFAVVSHALGSYAFVPLRQERYVAIGAALGVAVNLFSAVVFAIWFGAAGMAIARVLSEAALAGFLALAALRTGILRQPVAIPAALS